MISPTQKDFLINGNFPFPSAFFFLPQSFFFPSPKSVLARTRTFSRFLSHTALTFSAQLRTSFWPKRRTLWMQSNEESKYKISSEKEDSRAHRFIGKEGANSTLVHRFLVQEANYQDTIQRGIKVKNLTREREARKKRGTHTFLATALELWAQIRLRPSITHNFVPYSSRTAHMHEPKGSSERERAHWRGMTSEC